MAIAEVIKFEGPQDALVWKFPIEDFNATSQLIVDETHEALLVVNGNAADLFTAGRRTLSVPNIPIARTLIEIPTGGNSPFPCKVFFINKVHAMDLLWGTQGPIALEDMLYDNNEAADTIAHELWHAYQHERAMNPQSAKDYQYQYGFENYIRPDDDFTAYQDQLVEAEARAFAQQFKDRLSTKRRSI